MAESKELTSALTLVKRMPPSSVENCLAGLLSVAPHLTDDLLNNVDVPLTIETDSKDGRSFIKCDFNRDGDAYRSPWSNTYFEEGEAVDGELFPRSDLRTLEIEANAIFDVYRRMYFGDGSISSVYFFETEEGNASAWGATFLIHKVVPQANDLKNGWWNSTHVFDAKGDGSNWTYELSSAVMVSMLMSSDGLGDVNLSGSSTKQSSKTFAVDVNHPHIENIGRMLENQELEMRNETEGTYIAKTRQVINGMRSPDAQKMQQWESVQKSLNAALKENSKAQ